MGIFVPEAVARFDARDRAREWYETQSERLGLTVEELDDAVLRGWCGDVIAELPASRASDLAGPPPLDEELAAGIARIRAAPIRPLRPTDGDIRRRWRQ